MRAARLHDALGRLTVAIRDVESELAAMKAEHDPLASHIFVSRRHFRNVNDTKSGKRREMTARLSFNTACELGFAAASTNGSGSWALLRDGERPASQFLETLRSSSGRTTQGRRRTLAKKTKIKSVSTARTILSGTKSTKSATSRELLSQRLSSLPSNCANASSSWAVNCR